MQILEIIKKRFKKSPYRSVGIGWVREKIIKHDSSIGLKKIKVNGKLVYYNSNEELVHCLKEIFFENIYSFRSNSDHPIIYDCGSHIGMSILYFKLNHPSAVVHGFEPDSTNFQLLTRNVNEWGFKDVHLFQHPVWNEEKDINFEASGAMGGKISTEVGKNSLSHSLKALRLSKLIENRIDLLKIDIEGAEYEVLVDCKEKLHLVNNLFVEYHSTFDESYKLIEILKILSDTGFNFYIKEANNVYPVPFQKKKINTHFDLQLNIFAFRDTV